MHFKQNKHKADITQSGQERILKYSKINADKICTYTRFGSRADGAHSKGIRNIGFQQNKYFPIREWEIAVFFIYIKY